MKQNQLNLLELCIFDRLKRLADPRFYILVMLFLLSSVAVYAQDPTTIQGVVRTSKGELISGVTVQVKDTRMVTQTDKEGFYSFNSIALNVSITFSRLGFKSQTLDLGLINGRENIQDVILIQEIKSLDEISITEKFSGSNFKVMEPVEFHSYPNVSGSFESLIKNMPGVSVNNELSSQYSVRGGNFDENLLYINDIEIFRPQLFAKGQQEGLGVVNPDLAGSVRFSSGGFEARYGDKLSSVLDVRYAKPDTFSLEASVSLLGSSAAIKVPFKHSYLLAGVRNKNNQDLLEKQNLAGKYDADFSDYQILYKLDITPKFNFSVFGNYNHGKLAITPDERETEFGTSDEVLKLLVTYDGSESTKYKALTGAVTFGYNFSNTFSAKWTSSISKISESENTDLLGWYSFDERDGGLGPGRSGSLLGRGSQYDFIQNHLKSQIYNSELRVYKQLRKSFLEMGVKYQNDQIDDQILDLTAVDSTGYSLRGASGFRYIEDINQNNSARINRLTGFLQNTFTLNPYFTFAAGVRANYNSFTEETLISPRISMMYFPGYSDRLVLRFSAGTYAQAPYYRELRNFNGSINFSSKSQKSYQLLSGADYKFSGLGTQLKLTSELYYKFLRNLTPYKIEDLQLRYFANQKSKGYAAGADFSLSGNFAKDLESSFRLSVMKTEEDISNDVYYQNVGGSLVAINPGYLRRPSDQRINMGILFQDRLLQNPTYKVHLNLLYGSALPTGPSGSQRYMDNFKIPAYKRVDIGFSKDFADPESARMIPFVKKYFQSLNAYVEIFNLLNIKNTASYLWLNDVNDIQYAVPNYLTFRKFNLRIAAKLKSR